MDEKTINYKLDYIINDVSRFRAVTALSAIINDCRVRHIAALGVEYDRRDKLFTIDGDGYITNIVELDVLLFLDILQDVFDLDQYEYDKLCKLFLTRGKVRDKVERLAEIILSTKNLLYLLSEFDAMHMRLFASVIINDSGIGKAILEYRYPYGMSYIIDINDNIVDEFFIHHTSLGHMVNLKTSYGLWSIVVRDKDDLNLAVREYVDSFILKRR